MESNDATRPGITTNIGENILCREPSTIIARYHIPHNHPIATMPECLVLPYLYPSVGRTEQIGLQEFVGLLGIGQIMPTPVLETTDVIIGVVAYAVPPPLDLLKEMGIFVHILPYHEKRGPCIEAIQHIQDKRRGLGDGTVVEGQVNGLLVSVHPPQGMRVYPTQINCGLLYEHTLQTIL